MFYWHLREKLHKQFYLHCSSAWFILHNEGGLLFPSVIGLILLDFLVYIFVDSFNFENNCKL